MVKVSVIIPVYNAERYLKKCLDSICVQTLKEIQIICVNDGSTDDSLKILQDFARKDCRFIVLSQTNQYAGVARNKGMKYAVGKYLAFLDADDYFEPDMLEKMYLRAEEDNLEVVMCRFSRYDEQTGEMVIPGRTFEDSFFHDKEVFSGISLKHAGIFQITNGWAWDKLFRTDFVQQCGYEFSDFRSSEDGFFSYMLVARAKRMSYMDDILVTHRVNELNSLSSTKEKNWLNGFKMLLLIKDELIERDIYNIDEQSFLNRVVSFLTWYLDSMNSFGAYKNCYMYMKTYMESQVGVLKHSREYYFQEELYDCYQRVITLSLEEYLYWENKKHINNIYIQSETIRKQWRTIAERGWVFPYHLMEKGKTVVLYGAGKLGQAYYSQLADSGFCRELIWVDKQYDKYAYMGVVVQKPEIITQKKFDYIFLAVKDKDSQKEVREWLFAQGVASEKIKGFGQK